MTTLRTYSALFVLASACALALAACGGGSSSSGSSSGTTGETVSVADVKGVGDVLVDAQGGALYSPAQEAGGKIFCTDGCTSIWVPLTVPDGRQPSASGDLQNELGVVRRPDGADQVTFEGKPLYTFAEDKAPNTVTGNGVTDSFGGMSFTWHVASTEAVSSGSTSSGGGYGY
jgi:predicted lipoprotein with Yx(FWY)xxD motif